MNICQDAVLSHDILLLVEHMHFFCLNACKKDKAKRTKKKAKKPRGHKKKLKESECTDDLMAELPFAGTKVWKDLECE